jgi:hypothetical protein
MSDIPSTARWNYLSCNHKAPPSIRVRHSFCSITKPHCQQTCRITRPTSSSSTAVLISVAPPDPGCWAIFFISWREKRPAQTEKGCYDVF